MFLFHDPFIDLRVGLLLMITGEGSYRVSKRKIYAASLEECAKVQKCRSNAGFSSSKRNSYFCKVLGASTKVT